MATRGEIRGEFFMALAPVYLITSNYLMQAALKRVAVDFTTVLFLVLSVLFIVLALWLGFVAFLGRPKEAAELTYKLCTHFFFVSITAVVFAVGWLGTTVDLLEYGPNPIYMWTYMIMGLLIYIAIFVFVIYRDIKNKDAAST